MCVYICMFVCVHIYIYIYIYVCVCVYLPVCVCVCVGYKDFLFVHLVGLFSDGVPISTSQADHEAPCTTS